MYMCTYVCVRVCACARACEGKRGVRGWGNVGGAHEPYGVGALRHILRTSESTDAILNLRAPMLLLRILCPKLSRGPLPRACTPSTAGAAAGWEPTPYSVQGCVCAFGGQEAQHHLMAPFPLQKLGQPRAQPHCSFTQVGHPVCHGSHSMQARACMCSASQAASALLQEHAHVHACMCACAHVHGGRTREGRCPPKKNARARLRPQGAASIPLQ